MNSSGVNLIMALVGQVSWIQVIISIFADLIVIFVCFPVRSYAKGFVAKLCGDDTAERMGRLTLNPFAHFDLIGALMIFVCNIGFTKPMPIDLRRCRKVSEKTANILVALAGPLANMLMAFILLIPYRILMVQAEAQGSEVIYWAAMALYIAAEINVFLMIFNLIPLPPFDGYEVLATFLPLKARLFMERNARIFQIVVLLLIFSDILDIPLAIATNGIMTFLQLPLFFIG